MTADNAARRADLAQRIEAALLAGTATAELRQRLAGLDRQFAELAHTEVRAREQAEQARADRIEAAAQSTVAALAERREAVLQDVPLPPTFEVLLMSDAITYAARDLERASADLLEAGEALQAALAAAELVAGRVASREQARAEIIARRAGGTDPRSGDGAALEEIAADLEGLQPIAACAGQALAAARTEHARCVAERAKAVSQLTAAEDATLSEALLERLGELDATMVDALARLTAAERRMHRTPLWCGSHALRQELQRRARERPDLSTSDAVWRAQGRPARPNGNGHAA